MAQSAETMTTSTSPAGSAEAMMPVTITHLVLIALALVLTLVMIWYGARLRHRRREAEADLEDRGMVERVDEAAPVTPPDASRSSEETLQPDATIAPHAQPESQPAAPDQPAQAVPEAPAPRVEPIAPRPAPVEVPPVAVAPSPPPIADTPVPATPAATEPGSPPVTILKGLGPKVAAQLAERGILTVADLATLTPQQAEALDAGLGPFQGRMARDRWLEQAQLLHAGDREAYEAQFGKLG